MDTVILEHQISQQRTPGYYDNFRDYIELIMQRKSLSNNVDYLETRLSEIQEEIDWFTIANENFDATQHLEEIECIQGEIDVKEARMVEIDKNVKEEHVTGPCTKSLDIILKEIGVERQVYYGNTINGNHCHLLLKEKYCETVWNDIQCDIM